MKKYNLDNRVFIDVSTHETYLINDNNNKYIYKKRVEADEALSPFWSELKEIYGLTYENYIKTLPSLYEILSQNKIIPIPKLLEFKYAKDYSYQLIEFIEGKSYKPDKFPNSKNIAYKLGRYIGSLHQKEYQYYGTIYNHTKTNFKLNFFNSMKEYIKNNYANDKLLLERLEHYKKIYKESSSYSLIMADISGNQFIYNDNYDDIIANVDLDAYVIGPRDLELTIIKDSLEDYLWDYFKKGYEEFVKLDLLVNYDVYKFYFSLLGD